MDVQETSDGLGLQWEFTWLGGQPIAKGGMNPEYGNQKRIESPHSVWTRVKVPGDQPGGGTTADFRWWQRAGHSRSQHPRQAEPISIGTRACEVELAIHDSMHVQLNKQTPKNLLR